MICGIGNDIIEIKRIEEALNRTKSFLSKVFSECEIEYFKKKNMKMETIAGNFATKEAFSKAVGTGVRGFSLNEIEVLRDELGKPYIRISKKIETLFNLEKAKIHTSISHNKTSAISFVVIERE